MENIASAFTKTRADNLPEDLFGEFIVPPFFRRFDMSAERKSLRILGGRGCGKTMLLRYFCHGTAFSRDRLDISDSELERVGLYFRPDTNFCSLITEAWLGNEARVAFSYYVMLSLVGELCRALQSISLAPLSAGPLDIGAIRVGGYVERLLQLPARDLETLEQTIMQRLADFELWVCNPKKHEAPTFSAFPRVIQAIADDISSASPRLSKIAFRVFIDEFENLQHPQREIICDAIKHPTSRLIVHFAHKRDAIRDFKTSSDEQIVEKHDYRTIDIERLLKDGERDFQLLAAELFLLRLWQAGRRDFDCSVFDPRKLHDPAFLSERLDNSYQSAVIACASRILPHPNSNDIARLVIEDAPLRRRLREMIIHGLGLHGIKEDPDSLISDEFPKASIVLGALLNRRTQGPDLIQKYRSSIASRGADKNDPFFKRGGWIDNNLHGCLFYLYAGLPRRPNLLYSGFDRFHKLASPSLRFFQELCYSALLNGEDESGGATLELSFEAQARAAKQVSDAIFADILQLGKAGEKLLELARRLGSLFEAFQRRKAQSEPEINHFSIDLVDRGRLSSSTEVLLQEAKIWSVLFEEEDTKNKSDYDVSHTDIILSQILAPHFSISYRKRRKVTLKASQVDTLFSGSAEHFESLLKTLVGDDLGDSRPAMRSLFEDE